MIESFFPHAAIDDSLREMMGFLSAGGNRIGWISHGDPKPTGFPRAGESVEIEADSSILSYPLPPLNPKPGAVLYGLALTEDGNAFVNVSVDQNSQRLYKLDRKQKSWQPVFVPSMDLTGTFLLGASNNTVAFWEPRSTKVRLFTLE